MENSEFRKMLIKNLLDETNEVCRILGSSIVKLRTK